ncbi:MAG: glycosyltransferase [Hyphomicrobiales bacterium]|nr:glycosyltransferase [Hyphomicrobiales bacterium]
MAESRITQPVLFYFPGNMLLRNAGSQSRARWFLEFLIENFDDVTVYSHFNNYAWPWTEGHVAQFAKEYPSVQLILETETRTTEYIKRSKNLLIPFFPSMSPKILNMNAPWKGQKLARYFSQKPDAVVFCSFVDGLTQLGNLHGRPYYIDTHDIKFSHHIKLRKKKASDLDVIRKFRGEVALLNNAEGVIAISPSEALIFHAILSNEKIYYVPLLPHAKSLNKGVYEYDILFIGSSVQLNVEGICGFVERESNWLHKYKIALGGPLCATPEVRNLAERHSNITLLGYVENLEDAYRLSKTTVSPLEGSGLKIKIVDSLAMNTPVFASRQSFDGLKPGYEDCVFPINRDIIEFILNDGGALARAEDSARKYYEIWRKSGDEQKLLERLRAA